jgi:uncharacterized protein
METKMTPVERQMLTGLFERIGSTAATPRDPEAEAFINDNIQAQPHAPYVLSQTVLVQQQALENAARRVQELEAQVKAQAPHEETSFLGNLGKSLFGGGASAPAAPRPSYDASAYARQPDPGYARQPQAYAPQPGPWGAPQAPAGGGILQSALTTATGVAGGMVLANALGGLFGGHSNGLFGGGMGSGFGGGYGGGETINNFYETAPNAAGLHAQDVLQDQDQDQDDAQDAQDAGYDSGNSDSGGGGDGGSFDT